MGDVQNKQVKMQEEQLEEMQVPGRTLSLAVDWHNATYNTVRALNVKTNKVLDIKIVHVKVRSTSLVFLKP